MPEKRPTCLEAALVVLKSAEGALHPQEIARRMIDQGLWRTTGKTPAATVSARIGEEINVRGAESRFERVSAGLFRAKDT